MLAVRINHFAPPSQLQIEELPKPTLVTGEVLVKVCAAGINPSDVKNVSGNMQHTSLLRTPGRGFAGIVVEGPDDLVGTEVWGTGGDIGFTRDRTHAEYIALPKEAVNPKPQSLSMEEVGSIRVTYATAWLCIDAAQLYAGETLLVIGATGVIGTVRRQSDHSLAQEANADIV